ncbi:hypothetical protein M9Y10_036287 [Tritrichomonas musculus]|uniref:VPS9 domain-containing protein n=1 Tax=Tritrichomonas musculus TaxID=1915356 RepID=A0ABR2GVS2_9EUKA
MNDENETTQEETKIDLLLEGFQPESIDEYAPQIILSPLTSTFHYQEVNHSTFSSHLSPFFDLLDQSSSFRERWKKFREFFYHYPSGSLSLLIDFYNSAKEWSKAFEPFEGKKFYFLRRGNHWPFFRLLMLPAFDEFFQTIAIIYKNDIKYEINLVNNQDFLDFIKHGQDSPISTVIDKIIKAYEKIFCISIYPQSVPTAYVPTKRNLNKKEDTKGSNDSDDYTPINEMNYNLSDTLHEILIEKRINLILNKYFGGKFKEENFLYSVPIYREFSIESGFQNKIKDKCYFEFFIEKVLESLPPYQQIFSHLMSGIPIIKNIKDPISFQNDSDSNLIFDKLRVRQSKLTFRYFLYSLSIIKNFYSILHIFQAYYSMGKNINPEIFKQVNTIFYQQFKLTKFIMKYEENFQLLIRQNILIFLYYIKQLKFIGNDAERRNRILKQDDDESDDEEIIYYPFSDDFNTLNPDSDIETSKEKKNLDKKANKKTTKKSTTIKDQKNDKKKDNTKDQKNDKGNDQKNDNKVDQKNDQEKEIKKTNKDSKTKSDQKNDKKSENRRKKSKNKGNDNDIDQKNAEFQIALLKLESIDEDTLYLKKLKSLIPSIFSTDALANSSSMFISMLIALCFKVKLANNIDEYFFQWPMAIDFRNTIDDFTNYSFLYIQQKRDGKHKMPSIVKKMIECATNPDDHPFNNNENTNFLCLFSIYDSAFIAAPDLREEIKKEAEEVLSDALNNVANCLMGYNDIDISLVRIEKEKEKKAKQNQNTKDKKDKKQQEKEEKKSEKQSSKQHKKQETNDQINTQNEEINDCSFQEYTDPRNNINNRFLSFLKIQSFPMLDNLYQIGSILSSRLNNLFIEKIDQHLHESLIEESIEVAINRLDEDRDKIILLNTRHDFLVANGACLYPFNDMMDSAMYIKKVGQIESRVSVKWGDRLVNDIINNFTFNLVNLNFTKPINENENSEFNTDKLFTLLKLTPFGGTTYYIKVILKSLSNDENMTKMITKINDFQKMLGQFSPCPIQPNGPNFESQYESYKEAIEKIKFDQEKFKEVFKQMELLGNHLCMLLILDLASQVDQSNHTTFSSYLLRSVEASKGKQACSFIFDEEWLRLYEPTPVSKNEEMAQIDTKFAYFERLKRQYGISEKEEQLQSNEITKIDRKSEVDLNSALMEGIEFFQELIQEREDLETNKIENMINAMLFWIAMNENAENFSGGFLICVVALLKALDMWNSFKIDFVLQRLCYQLKIKTKNQKTHNSIYTLYYQLELCDYFV